MLSIVFRKGPREGPVRRATASLFYYFLIARFVLVERGAVVLFRTVLSARPPAPRGVLYGRDTAHWLSLLDRLFVPTRQGRPKGDIHLKAIRVCIQLTAIVYGRDCFGFWTALFCSEDRDVSPAI